MNPYYVGNPWAGAIEGLMSGYEDARAINASRAKQEAELANLALVRQQAQQQLDLQQSAAEQNKAEYQRQMEGADALKQLFAPVPEMRQEAGYKLPPGQGFMATFGADKFNDPGMVSRPSGNMTTPAVTPDKLFQTALPYMDMKEIGNTYKEMGLAQKPTGLTEKDILTAIATGKIDPASMAQARKPDGTLDWGKVAIFDDKDKGPKATSKPYESVLGGKKILLQDYSDGTTKMVAQDSSTTNKISVTGNGMGKPPVGFRWDANGNLEAIPGGPADWKKTDRDMAQSSSISAIDNSLDAINKLKGHPGLKAGTGLQSGIDPRNYIRGTDAYDFQRELESFDSKLFLSNIGAMKGMGALSDAEGKKISAAAGAIKPGVSTKTLTNSLDTISRVLSESKNRQASVSTSANKPAQRTASQPDPATATRMIQKYGSKQAAIDAWNRGER